MRRELLKMVQIREKLESKLLGNLDKGQKLLVERQELSKTQLLHLCQVIKENGWLTEEIIKSDGVNAMLYIAANNREFDMQAELLPVMIEASKKGLIEKGYLATVIDNIRVGRGLPQIFGTQAKIQNNVVYIYPLVNESRLNEWRKAYNLPTMADSIKNLERRYVMPVLKMSRPATSPASKQKSNVGDETSILGIADEENEVLNIDTKLVSLNVRVLNPDLTSADALNLKEQDFAVFENGQEQKISFFSNTNQPFDLILLLDFSGSTVEKQGLIKKAAQRFVEVARPSDRIGVVVFTEEIRVISDLTTDRNQLIENIKNIKMTGGSRIWDALKYTYENIVEKQSQGRRSAVIFMTDGLDNSTDTTFADLMEVVRQGDTTVFPVYLDPSDYQFENVSRMAEKSLSLLAEESGGQIHPAKSVKNLVGIYERIISDLSKVYSISYEPSDEKRDGAWRELKIKIKSQPNLIVRSREGYYAN